MAPIDRPIYLERMSSYIAQMTPPILDQLAANPNKKVNVLPFTYTIEQCAHLV